MLDKLREDFPEDFEPEMEDEPLEEVPEQLEEEEVQLRKRKSSSKKKKKTSIVAKEEVEEEAAKEEASHVAYLKSAFAIFLMGVFFLDLFGLGLRGGSTPFIDWWDMIGTVAYVRGRHQQYDLKRRENQKNPLWILYIILNAFVLYEIAGKTCRTIMRHTPQIPSLLGFSDFVVYGLLPVHFFPGDHLFQLVEHNDIHQLIVCIYWGLTKVRSLHGQIREAVYVHHYNFAQAFLICLLSCEIASVVSRIDKNVTRFPMKECIKRMPGGLYAWLSSRTFMSSIFISLFMYATIMALPIPGVWVIPNVLAYFACFYRYANGLVERVLLDHFRLRERLSNFREYEAQLQSFVENLSAKSIQQSLQTVPETLVQESIKLTESLIMSLDQLNVESKQELQNFMSRLEEYSEELEETQAKRRKSKQE